MDDNAPTHQFMVPVHMPQAVGVRHFVPPTMQKLSAPLFDSPWVDMTETLPDPKPFYAVAQTAEVPGQCFLSGSGEVGHKPLYQCIQLSI